MKQWIPLGAAVALALAVLATWNYNHKRLVRAEQDAEAARLSLAHQIVADEESKRELQGNVEALLAQNASLKRAYEEARAAAPGARPVGAASLRTAPLTVESASEPETPPMPPECKPGEILYPDGRGTFFCQPQAAGAGKPPPPKLRACVLAEGDEVSLVADEIELQTNKGNTIITGAASAWRERPLPRRRVAEGIFESAVSRTASLEAPLPPRWGAEVLGQCQRDGCGLGAGVLLPPVSLLGLRWEARAGVMLGPSLSAAGGVGARW